MGVWPMLIKLIILSEMLIIALRLSVQLADPPGIVKAELSTMFIEQHSTN